MPNVSHWVLQTIEKGYQMQFGCRPPRFMGVLSTEVAPQQVLVMEQEIKAVRERGHIICTSLQQGNRVQPVFHSFKEGWRVASHFRSSSSERIRHAAQVQNVNFETNRVTNQIRGLVCHKRTQGRILSYIHSSMSQEVPEVRFWGQSIPISGSSVRPRIITPHFHEMRRCSLGTSSASGYSHYELHRRLVDSSSVASVGSSASRCRSCPH